MCHPYTKLNNTEIQVFKFSKKKNPVIISSSESNDYCCPPSIRPAHR